MVPAKPTTSWAFASLICSILAWLGAVPLPFIDYNYIGGATAGVGVIGPALLGLVSALLALLGLIFGLVALGRISAGTLGGRGKAWTGVALAGFLLLAYVAVSGRFLFGWW